MDDSAKLELLKLDLQRTGTALDALLIHYLERAADRIREMGITLTVTPGDDGLQISYAAHLYRNRQNPDAELPKSLAHELLSRLFNEKGGTGA